MEKAILGYRFFRINRLAVRRLATGIGPDSGKLDRSTESNGDSSDRDQHRRPIRVRFAPSPTGFVHIGSLRTIAYNYMFARNHLDGRFILRIEDTDRERIVPGAVEHLESTLTWLGMEPDESPSKGGPYGPYVQSERLDRYRQVAQRLVDEGNAYRCFCTKDRLALMRKEALKNRESIRYDNRCRSLTSDQIRQRLESDQPFALRFVLRSEPSSFVDSVFGTYQYDVQQHEGDPVIVKSDGFPTYHFANVVDDRLMEISHVIRGDEWLVSTIKHLQMYSALGWRPPTFAHVPPLTKAGGKGGKLSKRDAAADLDAYRRAGYEPEPLINCVLSTAGGFDSSINKKDKNRLYTLDELRPMFDLRKLNTKPTAFEPEYLNKYNRLYVVERSRTDLLTDFRRFVRERMIDHGNMEKELLDDTYLNRIFDQYLSDARVITLVQLIENPDHAFLWRKSSTLHDDFDRSTFGKQGSMIERKELIDFMDRLLIDFENRYRSDEDNYTIDGLKEFLRDLEKRTGIEHRLLLHAIRLMITNSSKGLPIAEMFYLLGKERAIERLRSGVEQLKKSAAVETKEAIG